MACIFSIIKTSIIFGTGVYTGIYVTQNYKVKRVNNPATVLSKIKSCIMKMLNKNSNKEAAKEPEKSVDNKDKTHPLGDADQPTKKPVATYAVTAVPKFRSKVTSVAHCDNIMAESKLNDKTGCIVKQIKSVKNNMFN
ncbi:uncharacterized protein LOC105385893 [Plutella xylostella]|uniref:uncharacterized protein LOC105385893 n=1 Tax=Plutella xylostella TaxID=51655 RepID=UPI0020327928|nr:uncharacterized protein LOC105385893 [Plutella xylostella]